MSVVAEDATNGEPGRHGKLVLQRFGVGADTSSQASRVPFLAARMRARLEIRNSSPNRLLTPCNRGAANGKNRSGLVAGFQDRGGRAEVSARYRTHFTMMRQPHTAGIVSAGPVVAYVNSPHACGILLVERFSCRFHVEVVV